MLGYGGSVDDDAQVQDARVQTCPACGGPMHPHERLRIPVVQCTDCHGIFLARASLADLIETENDWHVSRGPHTQPLPRITPEMQAPPSAPASASTHRARSFVDALFG